MIPKRAIEKAIEGGWPSGKHVQSCLAIGWQHKLYETALDPAFWQALGKALGWSMYGVPKGAPFNIEDSAWMHHARRFYDLILTDGDTEQFWKELGI